MEENQEHVKSDQYQQEMKLQVKVMEEHDILDHIIEERQNDINQISRIMSDIKHIATDFNVELEAQGSKLEDLETNMESVASNTKEATNQLNEANRRSRSNGRCLLIIAAVIILILVVFFAILFGTKVI